MSRVSLFFIRVNLCHPWLIPCRKLNQLETGDRDRREAAVYARHVGREWLFFQREKRFGSMATHAGTRLEDWLNCSTWWAERLHHASPLSGRTSEEHLRHRIRERFPK